MRLAHADRRSPPPSPRGHPLSSVRPPAWERAPLQTLRTDRGSCCSAYPRRSASSHEPGCLPPLRTWARLDDCSSTLPASASRSRRPHVVPMAGDNVLIGHCKRVACAELRGRDEPDLPPLDGHMRRVSLLALRLRESRVAFTTSCGERDSYVRSDSCESAPGPDDPSTPTWLSGRAGGGG
jgi:hypothetical protein